MSAHLAAHPESQIPTTLGAWLLPVGDGLQVAVGQFELKYIEHVQDAGSLPGLPAFCERGFVRRKRFIPLLDLPALMARKRLVAAKSEVLAAIVAHQNAQGEIEFGAILLQEAPRLISLAPDQALALGDLPEICRLFSVAAFSHEGIPYAVLDLNSLFSKSPAQLLSLH
jgi:hypothetical protein